MPAGDLAPFGGSTEGYRKEAQVAIFARAKPARRAGATNTPSNLSFQAKTSGYKVSVLVGEYETLVDLGRGGMADLYLAREVNDATGDLVVLKVLRASANARRSEMFHEEAWLSAGFDHPNVVRTLGVGEAGGRPFLALEFLDGPSADRIMHRVAERRGADPRIRSMMLGILAESLAGLHYAHELSRNGEPLGIVHRDFNPPNVVVTYDGHVKTVDFGIAKSAGRISRTTTGVVKGKVRYMAPEQALGMAIDRRADVFSAGVMLWEFCSGEPFWKAFPNDQAVFDELIGGSYPVTRSDETNGINAILTKALARDATERYQTVAEMRADILREIGREGPAMPMRATIADVLTDLFRDDRERMATMLARALSGTAAAPSSSSSSRPVEASGMMARTDVASPIKRLLRRLGIATFIVVLLPSVARADREAPPAAPPSPTPSAASPSSTAAVAAAEEHFQRGLKLFDDGDFKLALVELERSYDLAPNYRVLYNVGEVQFQLGSYAKALRTLTRYLEVGGERIPPNRRADVAKDLEALKIRTAHLRVLVDVAGADVLVDGESIGRSPLAEHELVDAGAHRVVVQRLGFVATSEALTLAGGDDKTLNVHLAPVEQKPNVRVVEVRESNGLGVVWVGWGLTAALAAGTVGALVGWRNADATLADLKNKPSTSTERQDQASSADTLRTVTFVVGGATLVAAGVSLFFTLKKSGDAGPSKSAAVMPRLEVGRGRVLLTTEF